MQCNSKPTNVPQNLKGLKEKTSIKKVFSFIENCLPEFKENFSNIKPEDGLSQELIYILDNKSREKLPTCAFSSEHMEDTSKGNSRRDDIGVRAVKGISLYATFYPNNKPFIAIEAKRLDSKIDKKRQKEYVVGRLDESKYIESGGIERFKKQIHGVGLIYVGMIGYLQTDDFDTWLKKINNWIDEEIKESTSKDLIWEKQDKLIPNSNNTLFATYNSKHQCKTKNIDMYHIWVDLKMD